IGLDAALAVVEEGLEEVRDREVLRRCDLAGGAEQPHPGPLDLGRRAPAGLALLRRLVAGVLAEVVLLAGGALDVPAPRLLAEPGFLPFSCTSGRSPQMPLAASPYAVSSWGSRIRT